MTCDIQYLDQAILPDLQKVDQIDQFVKFLFQNN